MCKTPVPSRYTDVFTILTYAKKDTEVPKEWIDSDPHMILGNAEQVSRREARSFRSDEGPRASLWTSQGEWAEG